MDLIGENGERLGVLSLEEAISMAKEKGLDVVCVNVNSRPVVCKCMDYGKYKFELQKREKLAKKKSKQKELKEIRVSAGIGDHDLDYKVKNARTFLENGNKVKVFLRFKGREIARKEYGTAVLEKIAKQLEDIAEVEKKPLMEGRNMFMILAKKK